jgi:hypothetical protein
VRPELDKYRHEYSRLNADNQRLFEENARHQLRLAELDKLRAECERLRNKVMTLEPLKVEADRLKSQNVVMQTELETLRRDNDAMRPEL